MSRMFNGASSFNGDISRVGISQILMVILPPCFKNANSFNQDIGVWDVSNISNVQSMFEGAAQFNQDIGPWRINISNGAII